MKSGVTRKDKIRNEYIRGSIGVASIIDKIQDNRLMWFGYVLKTEDTFLWEVKFCKINVCKKIERKAKKELIKSNIKRATINVEDTGDRSK